MKINLYDNCSVFKDSKENINLYFKGYIDNQGVIIKDAKEIFECFISCGVNDSISLISFFQKCKGEFVLVFEKKSKVYIVSDLVRSFNISYSYYENTLMITDNIEQFANDYSINLKLDKTKLEEYLLSNIVFEDRTIFENIFNLQPAEVVCIDKDKFNIRKLNYFEWLPLESYKSVNEKNEALKLDEKLLNSFKTLLKSCNPRMWILPLSGGHDSRLILDYLYKLKLKNVICFSYGRKGNLQSTIAKQLCQKIGYEYVFIDYDSLGIKDRSMNCWNYVKFSFMGNSVPHFQDFFAIEYMVSKGIIKTSDCIIPGHAFDFIAGSHYQFNKRFRRVTFKKMFNKFYPNWGYTKKSKQIKKQYHYFFKISKKRKFDLSGAIDYFNWNERQVKFIANSLRCYDFFGLQRRIPLWDKELVNYWMDIGGNNRDRRSFFKNIHRKYLMSDELKSIPFDYETHDKDKRNILKSFKSVISHVFNLLPSNLRVLAYDINIIKPKSFDYNEGYEQFLTGTSCSSKLFFGNNFSFLNRYLRPRFLHFKNVEFNSRISLMNLKRLIKEYHFD